MQLQGSIINVEVKNIQSDSCTNFTQLIVVKTVIISYFFDIANSPSEIKWNKEIIARGCTQTYISGEVSQVLGYILLAMFPA